MTASEPMYLICKYGGYYRPNCQGYTSSVVEAGRYTLAEAISETHPNGPDGPRDGMSYIPAPADLAAVPSHVKSGPQIAGYTYKGCANFHSEYWSEPSGDGETYDSGTSAKCRATDRNISTYYGSAPTTPDWCPASALEPQPDQHLPVAVRHSFDGYGWKYTDAGNGSDWLDRAMSYKDAELLYEGDTQCQMNKSK